MVFQFTSWHLTLGCIERSFGVHWAVYHRQQCIIRQHSCQAGRPLAMSTMYHDRLTRETRTSAGNSGHKPSVDFHPSVLDQTGADTYRQMDYIYV